MLTSTLKARRRWLGDQYSWRWRLRHLLLLLVLTWPKQMTQRQRQRTTQHPPHAVLCRCFEGALKRPHLCVPRGFGQLEHEARPGDLWGIGAGLRVNSTNIEG